MDTWKHRFEVTSSLIVLIRFLLICVLRNRYLHCFSLCTGIISLGFHRKLHQAISQKDSPHTRKRLAVELQNRTHLEIQGLRNGIPGQRVDVALNHDHLQVDVVELADLLCHLSRHPLQLVLHNRKLLLRFAGIQTGFFGLIEILKKNLARDIVLAGYAEKCEVQIAYAIGVAEPVSVYVETFGTEYQDKRFIEQYVRDSYDLTPKGIIDSLGLLDVDYNRVSAYGHFGKAELPWEK